MRTAVRGRTRTRGRSPLSTSLSTPSPTSAFGEGPFTKGLFADPPGTGLRDRGKCSTPDRAITNPDFSTAPKALETLPLPSVDVSAYVADETAAIALGKALFWDQQMGSDGIVACATCHFSFGVDARTKNTVAPGGFADAQSPNFDDDAFYGPNKDLNPEMFPFHAKVDPLKRTIDFPDDENLEGENEDPSDHEENILRNNNNDVVGSQGISRRLFKSLIKAGSGFAAVEKGAKEKKKTGAFLRRRNYSKKVRRAIERSLGETLQPPTGVAFHRYLLWDGRANDKFNGVSEHGDADADAKVWFSTGEGKAEQVSISIDNAALASQAVGPVLDNIETSFIGRTFSDVGKKMLTLTPLAGQEVHPEDSVFRKLLPVWKILR